MKLVVNTNTNTCRIYHYNGHPLQLILLKEITHSESREKSGDLTSDRQGHYKACGSARGAYSPHSEAKEVEIDKFSREIARELNQERIKHVFDELIVIASPHMHGLLLRHINKNVANLVINNIEKDLLHLNEHELLKFLQTHVKYKET